MTPVHFYFDFSSPYGYFAARRVDALVAGFGRGVDWHPILLGLVFETTGGRPLPSQPLKGDYARIDIPRTAGRLGLPYRHPSRFPVSGQAGCRAFYWLRERDPAAARGLALALFDALFVDDRDVGDPAVVIEVAAAQGVDRAALAAALADPRIKALPREATERAMQAGVFGSPLFIVDGEPYWGNDRLGEVAERLGSGPRA